MSSVRIPPTLWEKKLCSWIVCCGFAFLLVFFTYSTPVCDSYIIDLRSVIISALYLSIHSLVMWCFIYTLQVPSFLEKLLLYWWRGKIIAAISNVLVVFYHHNELVNVVCFMLLRFYCFFLSTHLHRADAHCTLLISAHPASIAHYLLSWWFFHFGGSRQL